MNKLQDIGFYTLSDERAKNATHESDLQRCELILTSRCNFSCPYCRGMMDGDKGDMSLMEAHAVVNEWCSDNLKNIRFSGGEPTLWKGLVDLVASAKNGGIERIALSTNGSADMDLYLKLIEAGVNDFSISLDSCCVDGGNKMAGNIPVFDKVINSIKELSKITYVTVGVVLTNDNYHELNEIVEFASNLGVDDIRIIPAAQVSKSLEGVDVSGEVYEKHPILKYRVTNFSNNNDVRGLKEDDNKHCPLVLDDMAIMNGKHYPCIIYMREHGAEIGDASESIKTIREKRKVWAETHNCFEDDICRNNCLDVCVDYNNKHLSFSK